MLKARRKEQIAPPLKFPDPREGLPEDPRPFLGSQHLIAAAAVQEHLSSRCLLAVVGPLGSGKSTVCQRAANSRWARQWFLQDENGQPVHRRYWVDLDDASPGADTQERVAHTLGRPTFAEALARVGNGRPCLLILDNADQAFGETDQSDTLEQLAGCVERGASIIVTRRTTTGLNVTRRWTDVVEVPGFVSHDESKALFDQLAPRHVSDLRAAAVVASCDRLPLAVTLLGRVAAGAELDLGSRSGDSRTGLGFAMEASSAMLDPEDRYLWSALSLFPAGFSNDDISEIFSSSADARERTIGLFAAGVLQRCEAGVRVPAPLRLPTSSANVHDAGGSDLWRRYVGRAQAVVGSVPAWATGAGAGPGPAQGAKGDQGEASGRRVRAQRASQVDAPAADAWLTRQVPTLRQLASVVPLPLDAFDLACAGLLNHRSSIDADALDRVLIRLIDAGMPEGAAESAQIAKQTDQAARIAAALEDQRRFETSAMVADTLAEAYRRDGDTRGQAGAMCQMGRSERFLGRYSDAETHLIEARRHFEKLDDGVGQGSALFELGQVDLDVGRLDDAETHLTEALTLFEVNDRPVGQANANLELVRVDLARGRPDDAERRLSDALDRYEEAGDRLGFANACLQLGQVELARGNFDSAERRFGGALDGYEQAGDKVGFATACLQLGQVELARGRLDSADRRFGGALAGYEQVGDKVGIANACLQMGQIDLARGMLEHAGQRLHQALVAYEQLGDRIGVANTSLLLGQVDLGRGELDAADQQLSAAQAAYDEIGDRMGSANSRQVGAMLRQAQGRRSHAMAMFAEASRLFSSIGRTASAGWSLAGAARTCTGKAERMGYAADAVRLLEEAGLAEAAAQLAAELAEPAPAPAPDLQPESEPELTWDPKWTRELIAVAHGDLDPSPTPLPDDRSTIEAEGAWSPDWPSGIDAITSAPVGEWTSRWLARNPTEAEIEAPDEPTRAWAFDQESDDQESDDQESDDDWQKGSEWNWPQPPTPHLTEAIDLPPDGLQFLEDESAAQGTDQQTLFGDGGDVVAPRKGLFRRGRRKD